MSTKGDTKLTVVTHDPWPVQEKRKARAAEILNNKEREAILRQLHIAMEWVDGGRKVSAKMLKELAMLEKRINATWEENLLPSRIRAAHAAGHPLSTSETGKEGAFAAVAKRYGGQAKTLKEKHYRIENAEKLPFLANTPKPRKMPK